MNVDLSISPEITSITGFGPASNPISNNSVHIIARNINKAIMIVNSWWKDTVIGLVHVHKIAHSKEVSSEATKCQLVASFTEDINYNACDKIMTKYWQTSGHLLTAVYPHGAVHVNGFYIQNVCVSL